MAGKIVESETSRRRVTLIKGDERWVFTCAAGEESALSRVLLDEVRSGVSDLEEVDAVIVGRLLSRWLPDGMVKVSHTGPLA